MKSKVIILNGRGGVGKDTFVDLCSKYIHCVHISSIAPVKNIAKAIGWSGQKTEKDRKFLSDLKDLLTEYNNLPFKYVQDYIMQFYTTYPEDALLFVDIRESSEISKVMSYTPCLSCLITNSRVPLIGSNHADRDAENYNYDFCISNDTSLGDLDAKAASFVKNLKNCTTPTH